MKTVNYKLGSVARNDGPLYFFRRFKLQNKKLKLLIILSFAVCGLHFAFPARAQVVDKIVAKVDDQVITESDVKGALETYENELQKNPAAKNQQQTGKNHREIVIQDIINEKILFGELERQKIEVSEEEINWALEDELRQKRSSMAEFENELSKKGYKLEDYKNNVREGLKRKKFMQKAIYPRIRISDYDLQEYYKKHPNDYEGFEKIRFLEIFLTPQSVSPGGNLLELGRAVYRQLRNGASFKEMAKKYSHGPFAGKGGDSGLLDTKTMRPELLHLLLRLPLNTLSNPIPLSNDVLFICKVIERKNPKPRPFNDVKELIREKYIEERVVDELERYIMEARANHFIEIR